MTVHVVHGTNGKPAASEQLIQAFRQLDHLGGELFIGFPVFGPQIESNAADAIYVSEAFGAVLFDLVEGSELGDHEQRQDDLARLLQSRLFQHRELVSRRALEVNPHTLTFAPAAGSSVLDPTNEYPVTDGAQLEKALDGLGVAPLSEDLFQKLRSAIQNISTLRRARKPRSVTREDSRGAKLHRLEQQIATLDPRQSEAVLETIQGVQRIRGLAGSGKTIVLALKAAYLHTQHPEWRIAVTYNARSLHDQFKRLINGFVIEQTGEEPDWTQLRIVNAWGGRGEDVPGLYYEFCLAHDLVPHDFSSARQRYGRDLAFAGACEEALESADPVRPSYDAILIDEAQDLPASFLRLCYEFLDDDHRLVYAYDELQNLSSESLPPTSEIFGINDRGLPRVDFDRPRPAGGPHFDIVLDKCYRNSRPVLVTAHALGFGIYREAPAYAEDGDTQLVQMFDQPSLWTDIGYSVERGRLEPGSEVTLERTSESSPHFLEEHSPTEDLIQFVRFDSIAAQNQWVSEQIQENLTTDELRHEDIVVINPNPLSTRSNVGPIRKALAEAGINSHTAGVDTASDVFFSRDRDSITFTGVFRAKGNEAGMVYVVNAEEGIGTRANLALVRNRLFTAITRSKAWVRVVGVGPDMDRLIEEFRRVEAEGFRLTFTYPTETQRQAIRILHRELNPDDETAVEGQRASARELLDNLERGSLFPQDLDRELRQRLRELLSDDD